MVQVMILCLLLDMCAGCVFRQRVAGELLIVAQLCNHVFIVIVVSQRLLGFIICFSCCRRLFVYVLMLMAYVTRFSFQQCP